MSPRPPKRKPKRPEVKEPPSRFAPAAFLSGSPEAVQALCDELATVAADRFSDLTGTTWESTGRAIAHQLRAAGHDLMNFDEGAGLQEWQATPWRASALLRGRQASPLCPSELALASFERFGRFAGYFIVESARRSDALPLHTFTPSRRSDQGDGLSTLRV